MSLSTDRFFFQALRTEGDIIELTQGRIFNPAREDIDEEEDKIPYIIISLDGTQNVPTDKDAQGEGRLDTDTISVLCVAEDRESLANLAELVRRTLRKALVDFGEDEAVEYGFSITDYAFAGGAVQFDPGKPCCFQTLTYSVENEIF